GGAAEAGGSGRREARERRRRGEGTKATWRPTTDLVTLDGAPATAVDGKGNRLTGAVLTFRQGRSRVDVESSTTVGSEAVLHPEGTGPARCWRPPACGKATGGGAGGSGSRPASAPGGGSGCVGP